MVLELRSNSKTAALLDMVPLTPSHISTSVLLILLSLSTLPSHVGRTASGHILRLLATGHYLREVEPDVFANNRASSYIDSGKTVAQLHEAFA